MKTIIFLPIRDYFSSRKRLFLKFIVPLIIGVMVFAGAFIFDVKNPLETFSDFIGVQINIVAILLSFSVAIITILVSADNSNIQKLKDTLSSKENYKPINKRQLSLFQVMLSSISYNAVVEIIYLVLLIGISLIKEVLPVGALKYLTAICVFMIVHVLYVLLESVAQMYLTFWDKK